MHDSEDFIEGGFTIYGAEDAVHQHCDHSSFHGFFFEFEIEGARHNEFLNFFVDFQDFAQDKSLFVAGAATLLAPSRDPVFIWNCGNGDAGALIEEFQNIFNRLAELTFEGRFFLAVAEAADESLRHIGTCLLYTSRCV